jgi:hypothetical protein
VKKRDLERHLSANGCVLARQAANHEVWRNKATGQAHNGAPTQGDQASDRARHLPPAGCAGSNRVSLNTPGIGPTPVYGRTEGSGGGVSFMAVGSLVQAIHSVEESVAPAERRWARGRLRTAPSGPQARVP